MQPARTSRLSAMVAVFAATVVLAACGSASKEGATGGSASTTIQPSAAVEGFASPYCVTARKWAVHEMNGGGDGAYARGGPAALKKWWDEQLAYLATSLQQAPPVIHDAEVVNERAIRTLLTPLLEKYGFDFERVQAEASASEKAFADHPTPELARAQETRNLYQDRVCGYGGSPPAADVTFTASAAAKPYCKAAAAQREGLDQIASSGFDPEEFRSFATSDTLSEALDTQDATAPSEIAADVKAVNEWVRTRWLKVAEEFDYDYRRILLEGSAEDLAAFTNWNPAIVEQDRRVTAYQEQVCGG
jgi:hypothetical protein